MDSSGTDLKLLQTRQEEILMGSKPYQIIFFRVEVYLHSSNGHEQTFYYQSRYNNFVLQSRFEHDSGPMTLRLCAFT